jgi:hypothetical protein
VWGSVSMINCMNSWCICWLFTHPSWLIFYFACVNCTIHSKHCAIKLFSTVCVCTYYNTMTLSNSVCKTTHNNKHQQPPPQKAYQKVAHLRFTPLWYAKSIRFHANDILFIMNAHICFYFDGINPLF